MEKNYNTDVIVVGAGPSGISCALEVARGGRRVVLIERAKYKGSKNMYGGAVYHNALKEVFKDEVDNLPYERIINSHTWSFLNNTGALELTYKNNFAINAYAIKRFDLEKWMIDIAKKEGVYYIPNTLVKELLVKNGVVYGIKTEFEEYYAPITVLADGANSLLARQIGLRNDIKPKNVILSVKETIKLDKKTIEERFRLDNDGSNGVSKMFFGGVNNIKNLFMMSFMYSFKDTVSLGVGVNLEDLSKNKLNINQVLEKIKQHNEIFPYIKNGKTIEYSAHLIPETGYKNMPKLSTNGAMIVGDAAGFVNSVHFEGTNFALISGKLAGETALEALRANDFSQSSLSLYRKKLEDSFILKDLYSYRNVIDELYKRANSLMIYYPRKMKDFFEILTSANCKSKSQQIRKFLFSFLKDRSIIELLKDIKAFSKCAFDVFFGR